MEDPNRFVILINYYFNFYFVGGLTFQSVLLYLIITKSPKSLENMKIFLLNTCIIQSLMICCVFFIQHRVLPNASSLAVLAYGPCRNFGPNVCFTTYHIFLGATFSGALSVSNTVLFRYLVLNNHEVTKNRMIAILAAANIAPVISTIIPFTDKWDFETVWNDTSEEHPSYDLSIYYPYPGFANVNSIQFLSATTILAIGAYCIPIGCFCLTWRVARIINEHRSMSKRTKDQARTLVRGLACQIITPVICYIPTFSLYTYSQTSKTEILLSEHLLIIMLSLPGVLDPFLNFYFVVPYRNAIKSLLSRNEREGMNSIPSSAVSSVIVKL